MFNPLVSILIPCYNAESWLAQTIESALAQTWSSKEIIIINDGSTDRSLAIARKFESRGVRVIDQSNRGASATRNHGMRISTGEFIQFLDADDLLAPDKISLQLERLKPGEDDVLLSAEWGRFRDSVTEADFRPNPLFADLSPVEFLTTALATHSMMHPGAWLTHRRLADKAGPWNEERSPNDDGEYFARVILAARAVRFCAGARSYYRSGLSHSLSQSKSESAWRAKLNSSVHTVDHLLAREDSSHTRRAAADALQRDIYDAYPRCADLTRQLQLRVRELGGSKLRYEAGPRFHALASLLGWRIAKRLRNRFS